MKSHDVIIIGGGIAGLTCAKYLELANIDYIIVSKILGGNLFNATTIYNFPTYDTVEGSLLATKMVDSMDLTKVEFDNIEGIGRVYAYPNCYTNADYMTKPFKYHKVFGESGKDYTAKAIVLATGSNPVRLNIGAPENCVHYCAICDAYKYRDRRVVVLGGSESAAQAALYLSPICDKVYIVYRKDEMKVCDYTKKLLSKKQNIECYSGKVLDAITPTENSKYNFVFSSNHGETDFRLIADGCFVCWGNKPATDFLRESEVELDDNGFIVHADGIHRPFTETTEPGIYVCGDCMQGAYHQLSIAAGNGATCALDVIKYLEGK